MSIFINIDIYSMKKVHRLPRLTQIIKIISVIGVISGLLFFIVFRPPTPWGGVTFGIIYCTINI